LGWRKHCCTQQFRYTSNHASESSLHAKSSKFSVDRSKLCWLVQDISPEQPCNSKRSNDSTGARTSKYTLQTSCEKIILFRSRTPLYHRSLSFFRLETDFLLCRRLLFPLRKLRRQRLYAHVRISRPIGLIPAVTQEVMDQSSPHLSGYPLLQGIYHLLLRTLDCPTFPLVLVPQT